MKAITSALGLVVCLYLVQAFPGLWSSTKKQFFLMLEAKHHVGYLTTSHHIIHKDKKLYLTLQDWFESDHIQAVYLMHDNANLTPVQSYTLITTLHNLKKIYPKPVVIYIATPTLTDKEISLASISDWSIIQPHATLKTQHNAHIYQGALTPLSKLPQPTSNLQELIDHHMFHQIGSFYDGITWLTNHMPDNKTLQLISPEKPAAWKLAYNYLYYTVRNIKAINASQSA